MSIELARTQRLHAEASAAHAEASATALQNSERVLDVQSRMDAITQRRIDGKSNDRDAAELFALNADMAVLQQMLGTARQVEAQARDQVTQAAQAVSSIQAEHQRAQAEAKFEALKTQVRAIEAVFCESLGELGRAGQAIGKLTFSSCYAKSDTLHRALDLNICPPKNS